MRTFSFLLSAHPTRPPYRQLFPVSTIDIAFSAKHHGVVARWAGRGMKMLHKDLSLVTLDHAGHSKTCGYWYLVQGYAGTAHTAFARRESLIHWLAERGLTLTEELPAPGVVSWQKIDGSYRSEMHGSYDTFFALDGVRTRALSNGDYTMAIITKDDEGVCVVNTLNPNCRDRPVYDYAESRAIHG